MHTPEPVEVRQAFADGERGMMATPVYRGADLAAGMTLQGPLLIEEETTTVYAGPDDRLTVDPWGNHMIALG